MARALTDAQTLLDWTGEVTGVTASDGNLIRCIELASQDIESICNRRFLSGTFAKSHSGDRALYYQDGPFALRGDTIWLADNDVQGAMALAPITATSSITEDGAALTVVMMPNAGTLTDGQYAAVYPNSGKVVRAEVVGGKLSRKPWAAGYSNIYASVTAGFTRLVRTPDPANPTGTMPEDVVQVCCELANKYRLAADRVTLDSVSMAGANVRFLGALSVDAMRILKQYTIARQPQTLEA